MQEIKGHVNQTKWNLKISRITVYDKSCCIPSGLISISFSLIGDIKACVISELKGMLAAPEKASDNLKKINRIFPDKKTTLII